MKKQTRVYIETGVWIIIILLGFYVGTQVGLRNGLTQCVDYEEYVEAHCSCPQPIENELELAYPLNISQIKK